MAWKSFRRERASGERKIAPAAKWIGLVNALARPPNDN